MIQSISWKVFLLTDGEVRYSLFPTASAGRC